MVVHMCTLCRKANALSNLQHCDSCERFRESQQRSITATVLRYEEDFGVAFVQAEENSEHIFEVAEPASESFETVLCDFDVDDCAPTEPSIVVAEEYCLQ